MGEFSICLFSTIFDKILRQHRTNASAAGWRVVFPFRAVWKTGNTPRIPLFSKPSAEEKSRATGSCRIVRCCPKDSFRNRLSSFFACYSFRADRSPRQNIKRGCLTKIKLHNKKAVIPSQCALLRGNLHRIWGSIPLKMEIATKVDVGHWFAMTVFLFVLTKRLLSETAPYLSG